MSILTTSKNCKSQAVMHTLVRCTSLASGLRIRGEACVFLIIPCTFEEMLTLSAPGFWCDNETRNRSWPRSQELSIKVARRISRFKRGCGAHLSVHSSIFAKHGYERHLQLSASPHFCCNDKARNIRFEPVPPTQAGLSNSKIWRKYR
jgi:hypothetical protein